MTIKIEVGKYYVTRDETIVRIDDCTEGLKYPYEWHSKNYGIVTWPVHGNYYFAEESAMDIMREATEDEIEAYNG